MMIRIKRIYDPPAEEDGARVLVDGLWPRGVKKEDAALDRWLKEVAPSAELRRWFGHDPEKWEEFRRRYERELEDRGEAIAILEQMRTQVGASEALTLLYAARDREHNNAVVLRDCLTRRAARGAAPDARSA